MQKKEKASRSVILSYLFSRTFLKNLLGVVAMFAIAFFLTFLWLQFYTRHGQELDMPDYKGMMLSDARKDAQEKSFQISIKDSLHLVGRPGGEIINQDPDPGSRVKERRTIYLTVTKDLPDQIPLSRLPLLYGKDFERKKRELQDHFEIRSKVVGKEYDPGVPGQILEVRYNGTMIVNDRGRKKDVEVEKGAVLEFIISERSGGSVTIPDLICQEYSAARFLLESIGLAVGDITYAGDVLDIESAYVISQVPSAADGSIGRGQIIHLEISSTKPKDCEE